MIIMSKSSHGLNMICSSCKAAEDFTNVGSWLHRDDTKLIFLVDPDQECLGFVVEDASASRPVAVQPAGIEETISFLEKEMVSGELVTLSLAHGTKGIEGSSKITLKSIASLHNLLLNLVALFFSDSRSKGIISEITANTDTSRFDHSGIFRREGRALELSVVHI